MPYVSPSDKRVAQRIGMRCREGSAYISASPTGPTGSSLMTIAVVLSAVKASAINEYVFNHDNGNVSGWIVNISSGTIGAVVKNSTPASVVSPYIALPVGRPSVFIARYNGVPNPNFLEVWLDGVSGGVTQLGTGFTPQVCGTAIGCHTTSILYAANTAIHECMFLDTYDVVASYPGGVAALTQQWQEDLQQGRYLTDPSAGALGANFWYWSARDSQQGLYGAATWVDRGPNAVSAVRAGSPQLAGLPMRFA